MAFGALIYRQQILPFTLMPESAIDSNCNPVAMIATLYLLRVRPIIQV